MCNWLTPFHLAESNLKKQSIKMYEKSSNLPNIFDTFVFQISELNVKCLLIEGREDNRENSSKLVPSGPLANIDKSKWYSLVNTRLFSRTLLNKYVVYLGTHFPKINLHLAFNFFSRKYFRNFTKGRVPALVSRKCHICGHKDELKRAPTD